MTAPAVMRVRMTRTVVPPEVTKGKEGFDMSNRSNKLSRRMRRVRFCLIAMLLLIALVLGVWILVLDEDAPLNGRLGRDIFTTAAPLSAGDTPEASGSAEPEATPTEAPTATQEPTPTPTPEQLPTPTPAPTDEPTAEPTDEPAAEPTDEPTVEPTDEPTAEPTDAPTPEPTDEPTPEPSFDPMPTPEAARVTLASAEGKLNLRSEPSTNGEILAELPHGKLVRVIGRENGWTQIEVDDKFGYVRSDYLTETATVSTIDRPYYIEVDRGMQVVRVYTIGEDGEYSILAREMICSTDSFERKPPNGSYIMNGEKLRWLITLTPDSYAQYATRITGHILFHSVPYSMLSANTLKEAEYGELGQNTSIGCVRLLCADARWIYENVPAGTVVRYMTSERDEEKLAELAPPPLASGNWDPTDKRDDNPDYSPDYEQAHPAATPVPGVTPAPTAPWTPDTYS